METSELLKQLRIDKAARAPRSRAGLLGLVGVVLLALAGSAVWLVLARAAPPTVRTATARAAAQSPDVGGSPEPGATLPGTWTSVWIVASG